MIKKILLAIVLVPVALVIVALAVANRHFVTVSYDPLGGGDPAFAVELPLFAVILASLLAGVVIGGVAAWLRQGKWRRAARRKADEAARWQREASVLREKAQAADESRALVAAAPPPPAGS